MLLASLPAVALAAPPPPPQPVSGDERYAVVPPGALMVADWGSGGGTLTQVAPAATVRVVSEQGDRVLVETASEADPGLCVPALDLDSVTVQLWVDRSDLAEVVVEGFSAGTSHRWVRVRPGLSVHPTALGSLTSAEAATVPRPDGVVVGRMFQPTEPFAQGEVRLDGPRKWAVPGLGSVATRAAAGAQLAGRTSRVVTSCVEITARSHDPPTEPWSLPTAASAPDHADADAFAAGTALSWPDGSAAGHLRRPVSIPGLVPDPDGTAACVSWELPGGTLPLCVAGARRTGSKPSVRVTHPWPRAFSNTELEVKRRVQPAYPEAALPLNLGRVECRIHVEVDDTGTPTRASPGDCPRAFVRASIEALLESRWYPKKVGGQAVPFATFVAVVYLLPGGPPPPPPPTDPPTRAYLDWFCSADNVWRYDGDLVLPVARAETESADGRSFHLPLEIAPAGIVGPIRGHDALVIAADTPTSVVAEAFGVLAEGASPDWSFTVALADPRTRALPPPPPGGDAVTNLVREMRERTRADPTSLSQVSARWWAASGECRGALDLMATPATCREVAAKLAADLANPGCAMDADVAIAMFAFAWSRGEDGVPVVLVPLAALGPETLVGEGTWGDVAGAFLARPGAAMARSVASPGVGVVGGATPPFPGVRVLHHSELTVKTAVDARYPDGQHLGDLRCQVWVLVGADGHPVDAVVTSCPSPFQEAARDAILGWVWLPPPGGEAATVLSIAFHER